MSNPLARRLEKLEHAIGLAQPATLLKFELRPCSESREAATRRIYGDAPPPENLRWIVLTGMGCTCEQCSIEGRVKPAVLQ